MTDKNKSNVERYTLQVENATSEVLTCSFLDEEYEVPMGERRSFDSIPDGTYITFTGRLGIIESIGGLEAIRGQEATYRIYDNAYITYRDR